MGILSYTTYADIRAALGVSDEELSDDTLGLDLYAVNLEAELDDIDSGILTQYDVINAIDPGTRTPAQKKFYSLTGLYATYVVARQLGASLPMFSPLTVTDGKAAVGRFKDPYVATLTAIENQYAFVNGKLKDAYLALSATARTTVDLVFMGVASPSYDPVVGA